MVQVYSLASSSSSLSWIIFSLFSQGLNEKMQMDGWLVRPSVRASIQVQGLLPKITTLQRNCNENEKMPRNISISFKGKQAPFSEN